LPITRDNFAGNKM